MCITGIEKRRAGGRYDVAFDDGTAITLSARAARTLNVGDEADPQALASQYCASDIAEAYERLVRMLASRARTRAEMERDLAARGYTAETAREAIARCEASGWVDDAAIARACAETGRLSRAQVRAKLARRGVGGETLEGALDAVTDEDEARLARALYEKLMRAGKTPLAAAQALARRGFGYDVIKKMTQTEEGEM